MRWDMQYDATCVMLNTIAGCEHVLYGMYYCLLKLDSTMLYIISVKEAANFVFQRK